MRRPLRLVPPVLLAALAATLAAGPVEAAPAAWPQPAFDAALRWFNPDETTLSPANAAGLARTATRHPGYLQIGPATLSRGAVVLCDDLHGIGSWADAKRGGVRWSSVAIGGGCGAPALDVDTAYVTASLTSSGTWTNKITAVDRSNGRTRWQATGTPDDPFPAASFLNLNLPTLATGRVVVTNGRSLVTAYDADDGTQRWQARTGALNNQAAVDDGHVYVTTWGTASNTLFAYDLRHGTLAWQQPLDASNTEYPATAGAGRVFAGSDSGQVRAFSGADGTPLWQVFVGGYVAAPLALSPSALFVDAGTNTLLALDPATGTALWRATLPGTDHVASNLAVTNDLVAFTTVDFQANQHLVLLDARTGHRVVRMGDDTIAGDHANVLVAGGRVVVTDSQGELLVYALP